MRDAFLGSASRAALDRLIAALDRDELVRLCHDWLVWARDDQLPAEAGGEAAAWRTWLLLGGRGAGKTRAGAEWIRAQALGRQPLASEPATRIALVGETLNDVRQVMIEGVSGLLAVHPDDERPVFEPSKRLLTWPNGTLAQMYSADEPEGLRGPQFSVAWCDELAKWRHAERTWDMLQFALRLGAHPRQVVTTTPRPMPLLRRLLADPSTLVSRARTDDNAANLAPSFLEAVRLRYAASALGRQELDGEIVEDREDALWKRADLERMRVVTPPALARIVVAVDPPVTSGAAADTCGIVVVALGRDDRAYVLEDCSLKGHAPLVWARRAVEAYHGHEADRLVAEVNQGGELVAAIIRQVDPDLPIAMVRATRGKWLRAEPVAALYAEGRVSHVGTHAALEDQMCDFGPGGLTAGRSPDRLDALVWALTELMLGRSPKPRIRPV
ncbi:MAG: terminase family protein [Hyphomicrobiaceae bacterium]